MDFLKEWVRFILHFDQHLKMIIETCGPWTYAILFAIIFCETGLVIMPFLPGDSLLFAAGTFAVIAPETINIWVLVVSLSIAGIIGDTVNYWIGYGFGASKVATKIPFVKQEYLDRTQEFYNKYGGKTIILARFIPIIRTFAPFVAGIGKMNYKLFLFYNVVGGILWVSMFTLMGYYFGNLEFVKKNYELVIIAIIVISVVPVLWEMWAMRTRKKAAANTTTTEVQH
jgi:membrane-associated protein